MFNESTFRFNETFLKWLNLKAINESAFYDFDAEEDKFNVRTY
jgi:hypothetical protein